MSFEIFLNLMLTNVYRIKYPTNFLSIGGVFKWISLLGRVFKIHNNFLHYFIGFLTSINYMDKWITPLGRVFKIHNIFLHGFDKK